VRGVAARSLAVVLLLAAPAACFAAARVTGVVRTTLRPVPGVHVELPRVGSSAVSDSAGRFVLPGVTAGVHDLQIVAVGYVPVRGSVVVGARADSAGATVDAGPFLLVPLRPDEESIGFAAPAGSPPLPAAGPVPAAADTALPPVAPRIGFFRTEGEETRWPVRPELRSASNGPNGTAAEFADLLRRVAVADSITAATAGTGAPGFETWRQWGDRFAVFAGDSVRALEPALERDSALVLRAVAYARTRAALAAGATTAGYKLAGQARDALARARRGSRGDDAGFLSHLEREVDLLFPPGSAPPPPPKPAPRKRSTRRR
jgi:hypothetical protein